MTSSQPSYQVPELRLLTAADIAQTLSISKRYAYHLMETGRIPSVWIGSAIRVLPADLEAYIDSLPRCSR